MYISPFLSFCIHFYRAHTLMNYLSTQKLRYVKAEFLVGYAPILSRLCGSQFNDFSRQTKSLLFSVYYNSRELS